MENGINPGSLSGAITGLKPPISIKKIKEKY